MGEKLPPQEALAQTLEIGGDEPLILPDTVKSSLGLETGGSFTLIQFEGLVLVVSESPVVQEALEGMRQSFEAAGVTLEDLLSSLDEVRAEIYNERYGNPAPHARSEIDKQLLC